MSRFQERAAAYAEQNEKQDLSWLTVASRAVDLWMSGWKAGASPLRVRTELDRKFRVCFPLTAHAVNCVQAALELRQTLPWVASACARIAFEHALTAQWVLLTEDGEVALVDEMSKKGFVRASAFADAVNTLAQTDDAFADQALTPEEVAAITGDKPKSDWSAERLCDRFADTKLLYDIYRDLSGAVHPSMGLIAAHWTRTETHELDRLDVRGRASDNDELARALAISALWAVYVPEVMRADRSQAGKILALGEEAQVPVDLRASDQHPELQPTIAVY